MTYIAKPKLHHKALPTNKLASPIATMRDASRRFAPAAATTRSVLR